MDKMTIESKENIIKKVQIIAEKVENLVSKTTGYNLPITYLTIFSHTQQEYKNLLDLCSKLGIKSEANNGFKFLLKEPIQTIGGFIKNIRIREPDPYRSQIGCADVQVQDYTKFKLQEITKHPENLRIIKRPDYEMIEYFDLNTNDVLAYVMSNQ